MKKTQARLISGCAAPLVLAAVAFAATPGRPPYFRFTPAGGGTPPPAGACMASGLGTDYLVGPGQALTEIDQVPWENLQPGDTVRIQYRPAHYLGKFMIMAHGTQAKPVRICGVKGPNGERPVIDGNGAVTRPQLRTHYSATQILHQTRNVIIFKNDQALSNAYTDYPTYVTLDGLEITGEYGGTPFTDAAGNPQTYASTNANPFSACVWIERGHNITLRDNEIHDCANGIFTKSLDDVPGTDYTITKDITIESNYIHHCGVAGDDHEHNSYVQSQNVVYQFNHYGAQNPGAGGADLKDRSINAVIRYNLLDGGSRALDLVEIQDYEITALNDPNYYKTFVYGNFIVHDPNIGSAVHYGGDHFGGDKDGNGNPVPIWTLSNQPWGQGYYGESFFRKGTLYFYNNTVYLIKANGNNASPFFQFSTTDEHAEVFNNILWHDGATPSNAMGLLAQTGGIGSSWLQGGTTNLGVNLTNSTWWKAPDNFGDHPVYGPLFGDAKMLKTATAPMDLVTGSLVPGSPAVDASQPPPPNLPGDVAKACPNPGCFIYTSAWDPTFTVDYTRSTFPFPASTSLYAPASDATIAADVAAHPVLFEYTSDLKGRARPVHGTMDLGAFEQ